VIQPLPYTESTPQRVTYPRGFIAVTVRVDEGLTLRFVSTHFQHNVPEDRLAEARAINELFGQDDKVPTILAGDMNAVPDAKPIVELLKRWSSTSNDPPPPTAPSTDPKSRIDYVFYRPASAFRVLHSEVIAELIASDHRPVLTVLELR
jgi:endonuclease/exonuclease/phosphatase family metal-dependent hydrolase